MSLLKLILNTLSKIYQRYIKDISKIYQKIYQIKDLSKIYQRYIKDISKIYQRSIKDISFFKSAHPLEKAQQTRVLGVLPSVSTKSKSKY